MFDIFGELSSDEKSALEEKQIAWRNMQHKKNSVESRRLAFRTRPQKHFQFPALSISDCRALLNFAKASDWTANRHTAYPTTDVPLSLDSSHAKLIRSSVFPNVNERFGFCDSDLELLDLFIVKYEYGKRASLEPHMDGCLISFNILLNDVSEFDGGGTRFVESGTVVYLQPGECVAHDSKAVHEGLAISRGVRYIVVGFVETLRKVETLSKQAIISGRFPL